jgi:SapC
MNQQQASAQFSGRKFLYEKPELLTVEEHGSLGINPSAQRYDFVRNARAIPITAVEMATVQRHYPIVFTSIEQPTLLAIVGVLDERNLFVDDDGKWDASAYLPAYVRCHPFALAARSEDQFAVVIDRSAAVISEHAELPFFDGNKLAPQVQSLVDHAVQFDAQMRATQAFCEKLASKGLLAGQEVAFTPKDGGAEQPLGAYVAVDFEKLRDLDSATLQELHKDGTLAAVYAHRFSLDLWRQLVERRSRMLAGEYPGAVI